MAFYSAVLRKSYCCAVANLSKRSFVESQLCKIILENHKWEDLERNCKLRNHTNNVPLIRSLVAGIQHKETKKQAYILEKLNIEIKKLPNDTHPRIYSYGDIPQEILHHKSATLCSKAFDFNEICRQFNTLRMDHLGNFTGHKSYYLMGFLAEIENALIQYALANLKLKHFRLITVPDILPPNVIESCGMQTDGDRTQVYKLENGKCLSGTSEMALAAYFANSFFNESDLPLTVAAVSRCYRAETSGLPEEKGMYRVHHFSKVEMFSICSQKQSHNMLENFKDIEVELFRNLNLTFKVLDMPSKDLGAPAFEKYDIEAWMPGRKMWGEISSCSNCTDYQAKRLNIKYQCNNTGFIKYGHTVNGTAAAIPRLLISLLESNQDDDCIITLPKVLQKFINTEAQKYKIPKTKFAKLVKKFN